MQNYIIAGLVFVTIYAAIMVLFRSTEKKSRGKVARAQEPELIDPEAMLIAGSPESFVTRSEEWLHDPDRHK